WNLVEKGITTPDLKKKKKAKENSEDEDDEKIAAICVKDAKALGIIQNAVSDQIFPHIANADLAKMTWELLYGEYRGGDHVRSVKLQNLIREFEYTRMRGNESISDYHARLNELINQMKTFGKTVQKANCANQMEVAGNLFFANSTITEGQINGEWYIDSGCSNHMTGNVDLLVDTRTNVAGKVQMPIGALVNVAGMGSLVIDTNRGRKFIREMMYLPGLKENLQSVGQMDEHGYFLLLGGGICNVFDSSSLGCLIIRVQMKK
ncbi:unnamed protein product, partial [Prunus brigantina]